MKKIDFREKFLKRTKMKIKEATSKYDVFLMNVEKALEDLLSIQNLLAERIVEWYFYYFPEVSLPPLQLAKLVLAIDDKKDIDIDKLSFLDKVKAKEIRKIGKNSVGSDISKEDLNYVKKLASLYLEIEDLKDYYANSIDKLANKIAPNATYLVGGKLVAKFIMHAKGLEKLAEMPASTIQVLGAEKALFKYLKTKSKRPPKHGIILLSKYVSSLPKKLRGKMARTLASKLAIAFKADLSKSFIAKELKEAVEKRFSELKQEAKALKQTKKRKRK